MLDEGLIVCVSSPRTQKISTLLNMSERNYMTQEDSYYGVKGIIYCLFYGGSRNSRQQQCNSNRAPKGKLCAFFFSFFYQKEMTNVRGDRFVYPDMDIIYSIKVSKYYIVPLKYVQLHYLSIKKQQSLTSLKYQKLSLKQLEQSGKKQAIKQETPKPVCKCLLNF